MYTLGPKVSVVCMLGYGWGTTMFRVFDFYSLYFRETSAGRAFRKGIVLELCLSARVLDQTTVTRYGACGVVDNTKNAVQTRMKMKITMMKVTMVLRMILLFLLRKMIWQLVKSPCSKPAPTTFCYIPLHAI